MSEPWPPGFALRLEQICTAFEKAWRAGPRPRIEDHLAGEGEQRSALFRELLLLDLEYRARVSEMPNEAEYRQRFPTQATAIQWAFAQSAGDQELTAATGAPVSADPAWPVFPGYQVQHLGVLLCTSGVLSRTRLCVQYALSPDNLPVNPGLNFAISALPGLFPPFRGFR